MRDRGQMQTLLHQQEVCGSNHETSGNYPDCAVAHPRQLPHAVWIIPTRADRSPARTRPCSTVPVLAPLHRFQASNPRRTANQAKPGCCSPREDSTPAYLLTMKRLSLCAAPQLFYKKLLVNDRENLESNSWDFWTSSSYICQARSQGVMNHKGGNPIAVKIKNETRSCLLCPEHQLPMNKTPYNASR